MKTFISNILKSLLISCLIGMIVYIGVEYEKSTYGHPPQQTTLAPYYPYSAPRQLTPEEEQERKELNERIERHRNRCREEASKQKNHIDEFNDRYEDFLSDPEDDLTYPDEIFDLQMDENEEEYTYGELDY